MSIEENKRKFCNNVNAQRKKQNLTLEELSQRSGVPLEMLEALERGEIPEEMMVADAFGLARAFGREVYELFQ